MGPVGNMRVKNVTTERLEYLDFAKGIGMSGIVLMHYSAGILSGRISEISQLGGVGVHLFIILSGFGLGLANNEELSLKSFYYKRAVRVLFPYYLVILALFMINSVVSMSPDHSLYALCGHLFLYKMFDESIINSYGYHFWFLSSIVGLYIVFPFVLQIKKKIGNQNLILLSLFISISYWLAIVGLRVDKYRVYNGFCLQYLWEFCFGIVMADLYKIRHYMFWRQKSSVLLCGTILGFGLMGICAIKGGRIGRTLNDIPAALGIACFSGWLYSVSFRIRPLLRMFTFLGSISYEIYLVHVFFIIVIPLLTLKWFGDQVPLVSVFVALCFTLATAKALQKVCYGLSQFLK